MMKRDNIFWGICFLLGAILLIASRLWGDYDIGVLTIFITIICIAIIVRGIAAFNFYQMLIPIAMLCTLYDDQLNLTELTPWPVFGAAILASIGLDMLFRDKKSKRNQYNYEKHIHASFGSNDGNVGGAGNTSNQAGGQYAGEQIRLCNNFSSSAKYINSDNLKNAFLENAFGSMQVYFDKAMIQGVADVKVDVSFGEMVLYIPHTWYVTNDVKSFMGSVQVRGRNQSTGAPVLRLSGDVSFGTLVIQYI